MALTVAKTPTRGQQHAHSTPTPPTVGLFRPVGGDYREGSSFFKNTSAKRKTTLNKISFGGRRSGTQKASKSTSGGDQHFDFLMLPQLSNKRLQNIKVPKIVGGHIQMILGIKYQSIYPTVLHTFPMSAMRHTLDPALRAV